MFLSDARQSDVDFLYSSVVILKENSWANCLVKHLAIHFRHLVALRHITRDKDSLRVDFIVQIVARERCGGNGSTILSRNSLIGQFDTAETQPYATETVSII